MQISLSHFLSLLGSGSMFNSMAIINLNVTYYLVYRSRLELKGWKQDRSTTGLGASHFY